MRPGSNVVIHWNVCNCGWLELIMHGEELRFDEICSFCFRPHDAHAPPPPSGLPPPRPPGHGQVWRGWHGQTDCCAPHLRQMHFYKISIGLHHETPGKVV